MHADQNGSPPAVDESWRGGAVKWYDPDRRYGFIRADGAFDVFLHERAIKTSGIDPNALHDGCRISFRAHPTPGRKLLTAYELAIADGRDAA